MRHPPSLPPHPPSLRSHPPSLPPHPPSLLPERHLAPGAPSGLSLPQRVPLGALGSRVGARWRLDCSGRLQRCVARRRPHTSRGDRRIELPSRGHLARRSEEHRACDLRGKLLEQRCRGSRSLCGGYRFGHPSSRRAPWPRDTDRLDGTSRADRNVRHLSSVRRAHDGRVVSARSRLHALARVRLRARHGRHQG